MFIIPRSGFEEEEDPLKTEYSSEGEDEADDAKGSQESVVLRRKCTEHLPAFVFDRRLDARARCKLVEQELSEQARIVDDLRALGASHATLQLELRRLRDLEALVFKDFRRSNIHSYLWLPLSSEAVS